MIHFPQISNYIPSVSGITVKKTMICAVSAIALAALIASSTAIMADGYEDDIITDKCIDLCNRVIATFTDDGLNNLRLLGCSLRCWDSFRN